MKRSQKDKLDFREIDITIKKDDKTKKAKSEMDFDKRQRDTSVERLSKKADVSYRQEDGQFHKEIKEFAEFNDIPQAFWTKMQEASLDEENSPKTESPGEHDGTAEATSTQSTSNDILETRSIPSPSSRPDASASQEASSIDAQADTSSSPVVEKVHIKGETLKIEEDRENTWPTSSSPRLMNEKRKKVEECTPDTSVYLNSNSVQEAPIPRKVKEEPETTVDDATVGSTSTPRSCDSAMLPADSAGIMEPESTQPDNGKYEDFGDVSAMPSCSSPQPSSPVSAVNGENSGSPMEEPSSSSTPIVPPEPTIPMTRLSMSGEITHIPAVFCENEKLLRNVLSIETFRGLPEKTQTALKKYLPKYEESEDDLDRILECAFSDDESFCFGNTLSKLYYKLECNWFSPDRPCEELQLRDNRRVMYDHFHRHYFISTLRRLLVSRHRILEKVGGMSGTEESDFRLKSNTGFLKRRQIVDRLQERAKRRCQVILSDVRAQVGETDLSSDDEDDGYLKTRNTSNITGKYAGRSTVCASDFIGVRLDIDLHQPLSLGNPSDMLEEYMQLREREPDCMSLDISDITVDEVYERSGVSIVSERNFATQVRKRRLEENKCEADSSTDIRTNGHYSNHSEPSSTPHCQSVDGDEDGVSYSDVDQDTHCRSIDEPDTSSVLSLNGIHSEASDNSCEEDEDSQFEESLRKTEEANNLSSFLHSPAPS